MVHYVFSLLSFNNHFPNKHGLGSFSTSRLLFIHHQTPDGRGVASFMLAVLSLAPVNPDWFYLPGFIFWYQLTPFFYPGNPGQSPGAVKRL